MVIAPEHEATIERARAAFEPDERVMALWVEGSIARGTSDQWSDVDLHLAVADDAFEEFVANSREVIARLGRPLGYLETSLPGVRLLPAAIEGPVRVDLYVERRSAVQTIPRHPGRRMLFDRDFVADAFDSAPPLTFDARAQLEMLMRGYFFGAMWPRRMIGREDWGALLMNATGVVYQFIVPAMLIADGSPEFYREPYNRERFLGPARRAEVNALLGECIKAWAGIENGAPDPAGLARFHARLLGLVWRSFREACAVCGATYPEDAEREYRDYYRRELGIEVR